jgi:type II secretory pathway component PulF
MSGVFPAMVIQMISIGEKSGKLDQMLFDVADFYDQEIDYAIRNTTAVLEPMLLLIMGSGVAFIALSVLMPIFNLVKVFRH